MKKILLIISAFFIVFGAIGQAGATVITFDGLSNGNIVDGYGDLNWNNLRSSPGVYPDVAYANTPSPATVADGGVGDFIFNGVDITAITTSLSEVNVMGYLDGALVGSVSVAVNTSTPAYLDFNGGPVDQLVFSANGMYLMDNLTINEATHAPEPATMLLFGAGLAGLAGFRRKFKKA